MLKGLKTAHSHTGILENSRALIEDYLSRILDLSLKGGGQINRTQKGMGFLGSVVHPGFIRLSSRTKKRVCQKPWMAEKSCCRIQGNMTKGIYKENAARAPWRGLEQ